MQVVIKRPNGGPAADTTAGRITHILIEQGVKPQAIVHERLLGRPRRAGDRELPSAPSRSPTSAATGPTI